MEKKLKMSHKEKGCIGITKTLHVVSQVTLWFFLGAFMYQCFEKYVSWLTYYEIHVLRQNNTKVTEFPDITICSGDSGGLNKTVLSVSKDYLFL